MAIVQAINAEGKVVSFDTDKCALVTDDIISNPSTDGLSKGKPLRKKAEQRSRSFTLTGYHNEHDVVRFLKKQDWIHHWAIATHDKDVAVDGSSKKTHIHVLLYTYDGKTASSILKKFSVFSKEIADSIGEPIDNYRIEIMNDGGAQWRYLIHQDETDPTKYHYEPSIRNADDFSYWHNLDKSFNHSDVNNVGYTILQDVINGLSTRELCYRYGKEYIYHSQHYKNVIRDIYNEEFYKHKNDQGAFDTTMFTMLLDTSPFSQTDKNAFFMVLRYINQECIINYDSALQFYLNYTKEGT